MHKQIFPKKGNRIAIKDLGNLFPDSYVIADTFDMNGNAEKIDAIYTEMNRELFDLANRAKGDSNHHLVVMLRARQQVELLKVPVFVEIAQDAIEEGNSVAIFVNFNETAKTIADKLNTKCLIWGSNKTGERDKNIEDFQNGKERVIICNIQAGGVGISLHDINGNYPRVSLISPSWSAQNMLQALGRIWRAGSKSKAIQKIVFAAETIEEGICNVVRKKIANIHTINDGDLNTGLTF